MSVEAWVSLIVMALFNVISTAFYIGINKQMLNEVMRRMNIVEEAKESKDTVRLHVERLEQEAERLDREVISVRHDVKNLMQRAVRDNK